MSVSGNKKIGTATATANDGSVSNKVINGGAANRGMKQGLDVNYFTGKENAEIKFMISMDTASVINHFLNTHKVQSGQSVHKSIIDKMGQDNFVGSVISFLQHQLKDKKLPNNFDWLSGLSAHTSRVKLFNQGNFNIPAKNFIATQARLEDITVEEWLDGIREYLPVDCNGDTKLAEPKLLIDDIKVLLVDADVDRYYEFDVRSAVVAKICVKVISDFAAFITTLIKDNQANNTNDSYQLGFNAGYEKARNDILELWSNTSVK